MNEIPHVRKLGKVKSDQLQEISGIVPSVRYKGCFWVHNDSGDEANVYLIDSNANLLHTVHLQDVQAVDFEEIAWFHDENGLYRLIVGDIGDNLARRGDIAFYSFPEPTVDLGQQKSTIPYDEISVHRAVYPDGPRDAEAFFVDPHTLELLLISKRDFHVHVYTADFLTGKQTPKNTLVKRTQLPVHFVTAADISQDGSAILVKNLVDVFKWSRLSNESVVDALKKPYLKIPYVPEPQGEAIAFGMDNNIFYTISERPLFLDSYLYEYVY